VQQAVLTCQGDIDDPDFPHKCQHIFDKLSKVLDNRDLKVTKCEPWNSVKVTFNIPPEAAAKLAQLAEAGDQALKELGILSIQVEGGQVISMTMMDEDSDSETESPTTTPLKPAGGASKATATSHDSTLKDAKNHLLDASASATPDVSAVKQEPPSHLSAPEIMPSKPAVPAASASSSPMFPFPPLLNSPSRPGSSSSSSSSNSSNSSNGGSSGSAAALPGNMSAASAAAALLIKSMPVAVAAAVDRYQSLVSNRTSGKSDLFNVKDMNDEPPPKRSRKQETIEVGDNNLFGTGSGGGSGSSTSVNVTAAGTSGGTGSSTGGFNLRNLTGNGFTIHPVGSTANGSSGSSGRSSGTSSSSSGSQLSTSGSSNGRTASCSGSIDPVIGSSVKLANLPGVSLTSVNRSNQSNSLSSSRSGGGSSNSSSGSLMPPPSSSVTLSPVPRPTNSVGGSGERTTTASDHPTVSQRLSESGGETKRTSEPPPLSTSKQSWKTKSGKKVGNSNSSSSSSATLLINPVTGQFEVGPAESSTGGAAGAGNSTTDTEQTKLSSVGDGALLSAYSLSALSSSGPSSSKSSKVEPLLNSPGGGSSTSFEPSSSSSSSLKLKLKVLPSNSSKSVKESLAQSKNQTIKAVSSASSALSVASAAGGSSSADPEPKLPKLKIKLKEKSVELENNDDNSSKQTTTTDAMNALHCSAESSSEESSSSGSDQTATSSSSSSNSVGIPSSSIQLDIRTRVRIKPLPEKIAAVAAKTPDVHFTNINQINHISVDTNILSAPDTGKTTKRSKSAGKEKKTGKDRLAVWTESLAKHTKRGEDSSAATKETKSWPELLENRLFTQGSTTIAGTANLSSSFSKSEGHKNQTDKVDEKVSGESDNNHLNWAGPGREGAEPGPGHTPPLSPRPGSSHPSLGCAVSDDNLLVEPAQSDNRLAATDIRPSKSPEQIGKETMAGAGGNVASVTTGGNGVGGGVTSVLDILEGRRPLGEPPVSPLDSSNGGVGGVGGHHHNPVVDHAGNQQGEDSGIESMDTLSEKSPNQGESPFHASSSGCHDPCSIGIGGMIEGGSDRRLPTYSSSVGGPVVLSSGKLSPPVSDSGSSDSLVVADKSPPPLPSSSTAAVAPPSSNSSVPLPVINPSVAASPPSNQESSSTMNFSGSNNLSKSGEDTATVTVPVSPLSSSQCTATPIGDSDHRTVDSPHSKAELASAAEPNPHPPHQPDSSRHPSASCDSTMFITKNDISKVTKHSLDRPNSSQSNALTIDSEVVDSDSSLSTSSMRNISNSQSGFSSLTKNIPAQNGVVDGDDYEEEDEDSVSNHLLPPQVADTDLIRSYDGADDKCSPGGELPHLDIPPTVTVVATSADLTTMGQDNSSSSDVTISPNPTNNLSPAQVKGNKTVNHILDSTSNNSNNFKSDCNIITLKHVEVRGGCNARLTTSPPNSPPLPASSPSSVVSVVSTDTNVSKAVEIPAPAGATVAITTVGLPGLVSVAATTVSAVTAKSGQVSVLSSASATLASAGVTTVSVAQLFSSGSASLTKGVTVVGPGSGGGGAVMTATATSLQPLRAASLPQLRPGAKMVPVKLVSVPGGSGVRMVRVSPVKGGKEIVGTTAAVGSTGLPLPPRTVVIKSSLLKPIISSSADLLSAETSAAGPVVDSVAGSGGARTTCFVRVPPSHPANGVAGDLSTTTSLVRYPAAPNEQQPCLSSSSSSICDNNSPGPPTPSAREPSQTSVSQPSIVNSSVSSPNSSSQVTPTPTIYSGSKPTKISSSDQLTPQPLTNGLDNTSTSSQHPTKQRPVAGNAITNESIDVAEKTTPPPSLAQTNALSHKQPELVGSLSQQPLLKLQHAELTNGNVIDLRPDKRSSGKVAKGEKKIAPTTMLDCVDLLPNGEVDASVGGSLLRPLIGRDERPQSATPSVISDSCDGTESPILPESPSVVLPGKRSRRDTGSSVQSDKSDLSILSGQSASGVVGGSAGTEPAAKRVREEERTGRRGSTSSGGSVGAGAVVSSAGLRENSRSLERKKAGDDKFAKDKLAKDKSTEGKNDTGLGKKKTVVKSAGEAIKRAASLAAGSLAKNAKIKSEVSVGSGGPPAKKIGRLAAGVKDAAVKATASDKATAVASTNKEKPVVGVANAKLSIGNDKPDAARRVSTRVKKPDEALAGADKKKKR